MEPAADKGKVFIIRYFKSENTTQFLIPRTVYLKSLNMIKNIEKQSQVKIKIDGEEKPYLLADVSDNILVWKRVKQDRISKRN